jgi:Carboxypeptidase regulatory-like domain
MRIRALLCALTLCVSITAAGQQIDAPQPQRGSISGIVTDAVDAVIPGATIRLHAQAAGESRTATTNESGSFELRDLAPGVSYQITVSANGFADWTSPPVELRPGQALQMQAIQLKISVVETTVAAVTVEQLAREQVKAEEKQRVLGVIPNFYVSYDKHPVPMTTKLKYQMALRAATDIVSFAGSLTLAGINQAADAPDYQQGAAGFGQRFGAGYASSFSDIMLGGAILPSLLHQDPRYFYQGTGTRKSRAMHAIASPFICKGDNGRDQFNLSSIGGDLIAASLQNTYYPPSNRGVGIVISGALIDTGGRIANAIVQEFILQKYTTRAKKN